MKIRFIIMSVSVLLLLESVKALEILPEPIAIQADDIIEVIEPKEQIENRRFCKGLDTYTGCFIEFELGTQMAFENDKLNATTPLNLNVGFQWYFRENHGLRLKVSVGHINHIFNNRATAINGNVALNVSNSEYINETSIKESTFNDINVNSKYTITRDNLSALEYGLELGYLYEITRIQDNAIGIHLGSGIGLMQYLNKSFNVNQIHTDITVSGDVGNYQVDYTTPTFTQLSTRISSRLAFSMHFNIGVHYVYQSHHWFLLNYYYRETSANTISLSNGLNIYNPHKQNHRFTFAYAYKF